MKTHDTIPAAKGKIVITLLLIWLGASVIFAAAWALIQRNLSKKALASLEHELTRLTKDGTVGNRRED